MIRNPSEAFFIALLVIFAFPYLVWRLLKTDDYAPLVVVQIISGICLGPSIIGGVFESQYQAIFTDDVVKYLSGIAKLGVVLFVWTAGVELSLKEFVKTKKETASTAACALFAPLIFGVITAYGIHMFDGWVGVNAANWQFIFGVGMATAVTALPILVLLLEKLNLFSQELGKRVLRYASLDDIAIWSVLAIILLDFERIVRQIVFLCVYILASIAIRKFLTRLNNKRDLWAFSLAWVCLICYLADWSGLHYMIGGFLAGVILDKELFDEEDFLSFRNNVLMVLMPVFFLTTGLRTDWGGSSFSVFLVAVILLISSVSGKVGGVYIASKLNKWKPKEFLTVGFLLQTKALIEIIFCTILLDKGVISPQMFTSLVIMAVLSTMITYPVVSRVIKTKSSNI